MILKIQSSLHNSNFISNNLRNKALSRPIYRISEKWVFLIFLIFIANNLGKAQTRDSTLFISPLKIPLSISGGFGEIRTNHIHSGVDLRTNSEIGKTVYAAASGFISRIKVEPGGFGKAIYIDHPQGYTTVYAHLDAFREDITDYIRKKQYEALSFPIDLFLEKTDFPVKQGDSIAFSGNSGGSEGPHLHFEVRETIKQNPLQPLQFKLPIADSKAPSFYSLEVYPLGKQSRVKGKNKTLFVSLSQTENVYTPKSEDTILISGPVGFGAEVFDAVDSGAQKTGYAMLQVKMDSDLIYASDLSSFAFNETRYVNSLIDYNMYMSSRKKITKLYIDPNNRFSILKYAKKNGVINLQDTLVHSIQVTAGDAYMNKALLYFKIKLAPELPSAPLPADSCTQLFYCNRENNYQSDSVRFSTPLNALYKDFCFNIKKYPRLHGYYAQVYELGDSSTPVQYPVEISIKPQGLTPEMMQKAVIVRMIKNLPGSIGGTEDHGYIKGKTYIMGKFTIALDTTPPRITPLRGFTTNYQGVIKKYLAFKITDNLSGIGTYSGYIDGKWALFDYDAKNDILIHQLDESRFQYDTATFIRIEVSDSKGNKASLETKFKPSMIKGPQP